MDMFLKIIISAVIIEAIIEYFGGILSKDFHPKCIMSIAFGIAFSILYDIDLLAVFDLRSSVPFVGTIFTGILLSRGSNYMADLVKMFGGKI